MKHLRLFGQTDDRQSHKRLLRLSDQYWERLGELAEAKQLDRAAYLEHYVDDLEQAKEELRYLVAGMQDMAQQDQDYISDLTKEIEELQQDNQSLDEEAQQLDLEKADLQQKFQKLELENTSLQQKGQRFDTEKAALQQQVQKLETEKIALQQQVQKLDLEFVQKPDIEKTELQQQVQTLDSEKAALQQQGQTLDSETIQKPDNQETELQRQEQTHDQQETALQQNQSSDPGSIQPPNIEKTTQEQSVEVSNKANKLLLSMGVILSVVILFLVGGFSLPSTLHVERSIHIDAAPAEIFPLIGDLNEWQRWSPWAEMDPDMEVTISDSSEGQVFSWHSEEPMVGTGTLTIVDSSPPNSLHSHLDFGDQGMGDTTFLLDAEEEGTFVSWAFDSDVREGVPLLKQPISTYFKFFMDGMIGQDYEAGLNKIKALAEDHTDPSYSVTSSYSVQQMYQNIMQQFNVETETSLPNNNQDEGAGIESLDEVNPSS